MSRARRVLSAPLEGLRGDAPVTNPLIGAGLLVAVVLVLTIAIAGRLPFIAGEGGRLVAAEFTSANQVNDRTPVRVAGVEVGHVDAIAAGSTPGGAKVTMRILNDDVTLRSDARAAIRWRTVLGGNMYIDLQPGSASAAPLGDRAIARRHTSSQAELDDVTQILDGDTAQHQRGMLRGLRRGLSDPAATGRLVQTLGPALHTLRRGMQPLRGREADDLRRIVAAAARAAAGIGDDTRALQALAEGADQTFAVTDARSADVRALIALAPGSLRSTRQTLTRLATTLEHLDPLAARLSSAAPAIAPAARTATPALGQLRALLRDARPLLRDGRPALQATRRASLSGTPLIRALDPTIERLNGDLLAFLERRDDGTRLRNYEAIGPFAAAVGSAASEYNDAGHIVQFPILPGPNSVLPLSGAPGANARLTRTCRRTAPARAHGRCASAAGVLAKILGARR